MDLLDDLKKYPNTLIPAAGDGETFMQLTDSNVAAIFLSGALTARNLIAEESEGCFQLLSMPNLYIICELKRRNS